ncbi:MAG: RNA methyltransferase [Oscillospiraceae bacterium]|jgi:TrmH family RNA methyltransferase|nr:RNA methyltransferase [Oscillospiraceae bacterium]
MTDAGLTSRQNPLIQHLRRLGASREYRYARGEFLCDGIRCLREAVSSSIQITAVLAAEHTDTLPQTLRDRLHIVPDALMDYVSPLKTAQDVLFSCAMPDTDVSVAPDGRYIVLDGVQDPGNVGTILRAASAFGIDAVLLAGGCADPYNPKTARAAMGALFRQRVQEVSADALALAVSRGLVLYGASVGAGAVDAREIDFTAASVAIGSEGGGLSPEVLSLCRERVMIPMEPRTESLNAALAAGILLWETYRGR